MKTMRRTIATAAIGLVTAGVIGLAAPAASAAPVSDNAPQSTPIDCKPYLKAAEQYRELAAKYKAKGMYKQYAKALATADKYTHLYKKCIYG